MKRSAIALGASVLALALTAGPAGAAPDAVQTVDGSAGAAQVGSAEVNAPVRVLSDGENAPAATPATGPQTTGDSTAAAQVGSAEVNAPVRVLSDGDDGGSGTAGSGGGAAEQSTSDSTGSAQVRSVEADAPVRVLSDGDNGSSGATGSGADAGEQSTTDSTGSAQVGSPSVSAPVRVLSDGSDAAPTTAASAPQSTDGSTGTAQVGSPGVFAPARVLSETGATDGEGPGDGAGDGIPLVNVLPEEGDARSLRGTPAGSGLIDDGGDTTETTPALRLISGGAGDGTAVVETGGQGVETLRVAQLGTLPLTGLGVAAVAALGLWLLAGGLALRLVPGGKRR